MDYSLLNIINASKNIYQVDLFADIELAEGIDKKLVVDTIVLNYYDLMPLENNPVLYKLMVDLFFKKNKDSFNRINIALSEEYNALHNFDRFEDRNETRLNNHVDNFNENYINTNKVSAFNEDTFQNDNQNDSNTNTKRDSTDNDTLTTSNHLYGNIGVTTSQQMLESEIKLRRAHDIYTIIAEEFAKNLLLNCL